jgi:hypothetical protein
MNDYGFELLSDRKIDVEKLVTIRPLPQTKNLMDDIQASINAVEMARRRFRDIAMISGLIFQGFPGKQKRERHLQSSAQLLFNVFHEYESDNLLYLQTYEEVRTFQLEEARMRKGPGKNCIPNHGHQNPRKTQPLFLSTIGGPTPRKTHLRATRRPHQTHDDGAGKTVSGIPD